MLPRAKVAGLGRKDIRATVETQLPSSPVARGPASGRGRRSVARILASYVFTRLLLPDLRAASKPRLRQARHETRALSLSYALILAATCTRQMHAKPMGKVALG